MKWRGHPDLLTLEAVATRQGPGPSGPKWGRPQRASGEIDPENQGEQSRRKTLRTRSPTWGILDA